jgi:hypothetical protein
MHRELAVLYKADPSDSAALAEIEAIYLKALNNPSALPALEQIRSSAPPKLAVLIPNPKRVLEEKQDLTGKLLEMRAKLR